MAKTKYDKYILSGDRPWNPPGTGAVVAWIDDQVNNGAYTGSHQYYIHWVPPAPEGLPGKELERGFAPSLLNSPLQSSISVVSYK